ncbi:DMT family transporter [Lysinibacillus sp. AR18-8]|nr:DMT family transporter [Lysinibacillus sp. AR18-8]
MKIPPYLLLVLATLLWGGNFVIGRAVSEDIPPLTLAFLRWCVAFIIFFPIAFHQLKREWRLLKRHWFIVIILSLTGVTAFNTLVYIGLHYTTSINASLMNSSTPIMIYILSFIF